MPSTLNHLVAVFSHHGQGQLFGQVTWKHSKHSSDRQICCYVTHLLKAKTPDTSGAEVQNPVQITIVATVIKLNRIFESMH